MDEFLKIIYRNYAEEQGLYDDKRLEGEFAQTLKVIRGYLSKDLAEDAYMKILEESIEIKEIFFVEGMKLAIQIMNKQYVPQI